jgi:copper transporter 1
MTLLIPFLACSPSVVGPAWTYDSSVPKPLGEEVRGSSTHAIYTPDQLRHHPSLTLTQQYMMHHAVGSHSEAHGMGMAAHGMGMTMVFHWSTSATILFNWWRTTGYFSFWVSCFVIAMSAAGLVWLQASHKRLVGAETGGAGARFPRDVARYVSALLRAGRIALSYALMLVAMTYNAGLFIALIIGFFIGHAMTHTAGAGGAHVAVAEAEDDCCA